MARIVMTVMLHMHTSHRFAKSFGVLASMVRVSLGVALGLSPSCALDDGMQDPAADPAMDPATEEGEGGALAVCTTGPIRCHAQVRTFGAERRMAPHAAPLAATPIGFGPPDLQAAYKIDPTRLATATKPTVAIVDAYGYPKLEADLAVYRSQYGLPACTIANGCLKIVNQQGLTTNLPPAPPANDDWTIETALDVDMASAACPLCNILVVQATNNAGDGLDIGQNVAATLGATVISDSWGGVEVPNQAQAYATEDATYFVHPGIAIFVAAGDSGFNDTISTGRPTGPEYPASSAHTIAVGATRLVRDPTSTRGWKETAWAVTPLAAGGPDVSRGAGGSGCSLSIPKPAYQTASPCQFKASADIAAVGDPATGVAVYNTNNTNPGWISVGGTSAAAPFVAAIFAATGNGNQSSGSFIAASAAKLWDVTAGSNGTCAAQPLLCNAAAGWDGPTGFGTPNVSAFMPPPVGGGSGSGNGSGAGNGNGSGNGSDSGDDDLVGGCAVGGSGSSAAGLLLGLALLGIRRRR